MCHSGNVNDGSTFSSISFSGLNSEYVPGTTYDLTLTLNNGSTKNGFQLVVLDSITNSNSGTLILTDAVNTKITSGNNRDYLNHTLQETLKQVGIFSGQHLLHMLVLLKYIMHTTSRVIHTVTLPEMIYIQVLKH